MVPVLEAHHERFLVAVSAGTDGVREPSHRLPVRLLFVFVPLHLLRDVLVLAREDDEDPSPQPRVAAEVPESIAKFFVGQVGREHVVRGVSARQAGVPSRGDRGVEHAWGVARHESFARARGDERLGLGGGGGDGFRAVLERHRLAIADGGLEHRGDDAVGVRAVAEVGDRVLAPGGVSDERDGAVVGRDGFEERVQLEDVGGEVAHAETEVGGGEHGLDQAPGGVGVRERVGERGKVLQAHRTVGQAGDEHHRPARGTLGTGRERHERVGMALVHAEGAVQGRIGIRHRGDDVARDARAGRAGVRRARRRAGEMSDLSRRPERRAPRHGRARVRGNPIPAGVRSLQRVVSSESIDPRHP